MKKVFKFVKGKKEERKEGGGVGPSQCGDPVSPARTPEDEGFLGVDDPSGYDVDFGGKDKTLTKLHKAAWQGNLEKLKSALKKVEVDAVDRRNRTALHFAVARGHPNIVWFLLGNNADASVADDDGHTPLLKAIECGNKDCMNLLLDRGADVNASDYTGNTGLHVAVERSSLDTAAALLKRGADTEVSNNAGDYPLHVATRSENRDLVDLLLTSGASVDVLDRENRTPLMLAAKTGNCLLASKFVERGAQLSVVDSNGWTAQDYAMLGGHESVSVALKSFSKNGERKTCQKNGRSVPEADEDVASAGNGRTETSEETSTPLAKRNLDSEDEAGVSEKEKSEDLPESPDVEAIPPFCQPPRSWEMIQAGMIDENKNRIEPKRRSITTLGTLSSRRESFTESSVPSPRFTLSLNRRKGAKGSNAFAKQRFSFNEEESLRFWVNQEKAIRKGLESAESEKASTLDESPVVSESDRKSASEKGQDSAGSSSVGSREAGGGNSESGSGSGTLGRSGTMREVEEIWVPCSAPGQDKANSWDSEDAGSEREGNFPPPPTALELGIDMAKSIKYMKGMSVDRPPGCAADRNLWKDVRERRSLDFSEERDFAEASKKSDLQTRGRPASAQRDEDALKCQRPTDRFADVSKRIKEELECYDQALRELAESTGPCKKSPSHNYHSLPSVKSGGGGECRRSGSQELPSESSSRPLDGGPHSLPFPGRPRGSGSAEATDSSTSAEDAPAEATAAEKMDERPEKKTKRHMLLAMRDVKHAVHVAGSFKTSVDEQILSPLAMPEDGLESGERSSPRGRSGSDSPPDENPFFGVGRQQTVLERNGTGRKSSSSGTGDESTLWLQDDARRGPRSPDSDDDVPDIAADERPKDQRPSSFSPLGLIQKEMEEESRSAAPDGLAASPLENFARGESDERQEDVFGEPSPDVSLSSGPIEPMGEEKDSGSDPESSRNDASPTRDYALKSQHEWLKCHLKAATSEKNKLEELSARLAEKAERLQYELADAREAAKSRDEVIRLLQGQLARMEAAYTKSLEESVQSRLQLTSREQEILHLKELCFRHEEEKEAGAAGGGGDFLQELKLRIKMLEGEKEKMREEIIHLEEEKSFLEKRLKQGKNEESEMVDECQRWKERCRKLEEAAKAHESERTAVESDNDRERHLQEVRLRQQNLETEQKLMRLDEENCRLEARIRFLEAELDAERKMASAARQEHESVAEMKKKSSEMEIRLRKVEKDAEENLVKMLKDKEEEVEGLVKQFNRERENLVAGYERKLAEGSRGREREEAEEREGGSRWLRRVVEGLRDQMIQDRMQMNASVEDAHATLKEELRRLQEQWSSVSRTIAETQRGPPESTASKEKARAEDEVGTRESKSDIAELKARVDSLRELLEGEAGASGRRSESKRPGQEADGKRRSAGKEDELAWSSLYGMGVGGRRRSGRSTSVTEAKVGNGDPESANETKRRKRSGENISNRLLAAAEQEEEKEEANRKFEKYEFLELKKEILCLQTKMLDEKNLRHALENQLIKMNLDLTGKDNLEKEVNSLKKRFDGDFLRKSEVELFEYRRGLEVEREKYLAETQGKLASDDYKAICEAWAKERERSKGIRSESGGRAKSFDRPPAEAPPDLEFRPAPRPELLLHPRLVTLDSATKNRLERELDKSIGKYVRSESKGSQT